MSNNETNALTCSAFYLAELVGCATPDSRDSIGARFLTDAREAAIDAWDGLAFDWRDAPDRRAEYACEESFGRVTASVMGTADVWRTFVDLGAWERWESEDSAAVGDLDSTERAIVALDAIAGDVIYLVTAELARQAGDSDETD